MRKKIEKALKGAFETPEPQKKVEFLTSLPYPRATRFNFFTAQVGYIRKRVWFVSFVIIVAVLFGLRHQEDVNVLIWITASFLPFFAVLGITEMAKSMSYNMAELEMSCRYSLSDITLARLGIVGIVNAAISIIITAFILWRSEVSLLPIVAYLFTPYLLACALSLFSLNCFRGRERLYVCGGASCMVSVASAIILNPSYVDFMEINWLLWTFLASLVWTGAEAIKFIRNMEDTQWNLSLTA